MTDTDPRRTAARPSLTSAPNSDDGPVSILASLESEHRVVSHRRSPNKRWLWIGAAALAVVIASGYLFEVSPEQPAAAEARASDRPVLPVAPAASTAAEAANAMAASGDAPQSARIETVGAPFPSGRSDAALPGAGHDPFAALSQEASGAAPASAAAAASAAGSGKPSRAAPPVKTAAKAIHPRENAAQKGSTVTTAKARPPRPASDKRQDPDVALLAALMAHVAAPSSSAAQRASRRGAGPDKASPREDLSIAKLVERCEAMQGRKAVDCRRRICEGYWGKAQACPAPRRTMKGVDGAR